MLRETVERCPTDEWSNASHKNAFWQVAYHTLFFAHLYLQRDEAGFQRWGQHRGDGDGTKGAPYTQAQVLEYRSYCDHIVDSAVDSLDLDSAESGFSWYRMSKLEHQFVNIRHIQHHGGQLRIVSVPRGHRHQVGRRPTCGHGRLTVIVAKALGRIQPSL